MAVILDGAIRLDPVAYLECAKGGA